jgi:hypothetical protein
MRQPKTVSSRVKSECKLARRQSCAFNYCWRCRRLLRVTRGNKVQPASCSKQAVVTGEVRRRVSDSVIMASCRDRRDGRDVAETTPTCSRDAEHLHGRAAC